MPTATSYSKLGYLMLKKESSAGSAVYPDTALELLSEDIKVGWKTTPSETIAGNRSANLRPINDKVGPGEGTIEILVEPNTIGHFLNSLMGESSNTTLDTADYQHDWNGVLSTLPTYTLDIKMAGEDYIKRYFGVLIKSISLSLDNNKLKASISIMAQRAFSNARLTVAHATGTTLDLDQTSGITTSDTLIILDDDNKDTSLAELTIVSITSETQLVCSTIAVSLAIDDIAVLKAQTLTAANYNLSNEMIWSGGAEVYASAGSNSMQRLAAKTNCEEFELTLENDLEARYSATGVDVVDRMPTELIVKGWTVSGKFSQFHTNPNFLDALRSKEQIGLRFSFIGGLLIANAAAAASATVESDGVGTVSATVDATGEAGNDYAIIITQGTGALSAALSGKLITVTLDATPANNTVALVAAVIAALSGVGATSSGAGNVTTTDNLYKIDFASGRDASEKELLRLDIPNARLNPFDANISSDAVVEEEIEFTGFYDVNDRRDVKVRLRNEIADY